MKVRPVIFLMVAVLGCSACGAPSLRHKKEVNKYLAKEEYLTAVEQVEKYKNKEYNRRDSVLYYLDSAALLHDSHQFQASDERFALAQNKIEDLFSQSVSGHVGRYLINDLTLPYYPPSYEQALTYYYRAMNFLQQDKINEALIEANKAVFYLDHQRHRRNFRESPFVQYFASLVFESAGKKDSARIARQRALQAYGRSEEPDEFGKYQPDWGEVVVVHANGVVPLKKSQTFQVGWGEVLLWAQSPLEGEDTLSPQMQNAITAGLLGRSVTVAYPVLEKQEYHIKSSQVHTQDGRVFPTVLMEDVSAAVQEDLESKQTATMLRMALRAAAKRTAAVQAGHATEEMSGSEGWGTLAEMFISFLGAWLEKADTRQWFTLPAQMRMARLYVPAGRQDIVLRFKDGFGNIVGEHIFKDILVKPQGRVYLHYRTAK